ncbi:MAG: hypothetical protein ACLP1Y_05070 [Candidatus Acidiferrales bacterium]
MMPRTISHIRGLDDAKTRDMLGYLADRWSPVHPMPISAVVRECVRRVYETETETKEKRR